MSLLLVAYLSFADLEGLFLFISFGVGLIILFLYCSKRNFCSFVSGKYLDVLGLFLDSLVKKNFTILSSIEWKLITIIFPPLFNIFVAFIKPSINSDISLLTNILIPWKVLVEILIFFLKSFFYFFLLYQLNRVYILMA